MLRTIYLNFAERAAKTEADYFDLKGVTVLCL